MNTTRGQGTPVQGTPVTVPHLAETLVSATVGKWLKQPGDYVQQYDSLCELITDKVTTDMPSPIEGIIKEICVAEGVEAAVGETICIIEEASGATAELAAQAPVDVTLDESASSHTGGDDSGGEMSVRFSPAVLKLAAEQRVDLGQVVGTGIGGRITRKDVESYLASGLPPKQVPTPSQVAVRSTGIHLSQNPPTPRVEAVGEQTNRGEYMIDVTPIRNTIASRMRQSVTEIPHAWTMIEVDVTNLVLLRNKLKDEFMKQEGVNLTYLAFLLKAVVGAIKDYPIMNSVWAVDKIIVKRDINVSLSIGTEEFVITPVIKRADQKSIAGLALEIDDLTRRGRSGKLKLDDLQGGTFTVNNTGSFGSILSQPIINYPQAAILSFESIVKRPVVIHDMIAVRSMVNLCLSLDHRILDGVVCGRFLQRVKENLEAYGPDTKLY